jgi:hypothetical protein
LSLTPCEIATLIHTCTKGAVLSSDVVLSSTLSGSPFGLMPMIYIRGVVFEIQRKRCTIGNMDEKKKKSPKERTKAVRVENFIWNGWNVLYEYSRHWVDVIFLIALDGPLLRRVSRSRCPQRSGGRERLFLRQEIVGHRYSYKRRREMKYPSDCGRVNKRNARTSDKCVGDEPTTNVSACSTVIRSGVCTMYV